MNENKKTIYKDCHKAMFIPCLFNIFEETLSRLLIIYTTSIIGNFADAVFDMDINYGLSNIWKLLFCILVIIIILPILSFVCNVFMLKGALKHDRIIFSRFLDKKYSKIIEMEMGDVQYRLENDPNDFRYYYMEIITKFFLIPATLIFLLWNALKISWLFTLITFLISLVKLIIPIAIRKLQAKFDIQIREYNTCVRKYETDVVDKPYIIKMLGLKNVFIEKLDELYEKFFKDVFVKSVKYNNIAGSILSFIESFSSIIILLIGAVLVGMGEISAGSVAAMVGYFSVFNSILSDIGFIITQTPIMKNLSDRLHVLYSDQEIISNIKINDIVNIEIKNLSYNYGENKAFSNINFKIKQYDKVAVCGKNGSGKSTLLKIAAGLITGYAGSFKINGIELQKINLYNFRNKVAFAVQEPYLFSGTVKDNIKIGKANASDIEVERVMDLVSIKYLSDKKISMDNNDLSGGEKQKISIARALLKDAPILILDEPSNNLDSDSINWLKEIINNINKTVIYISHDNEMLSLSNYKIYM